MGPDVSVPDANPTDEISVQEAKPPQTRSFGGSEKFVNPKFKFTSGINFLPDYRQNVTDISSACALTANSFAQGHTVFYGAHQNDKRSELPPHSRKAAEIGIAWDLTSGNRCSPRSIFPGTQTCQHTNHKARRETSGSFKIQPLES